jgi:hypothetical protein
MLTSARRGISYPNPNRLDTPDIPTHIQNLVNALELDVVFAQGTHVARPANPGISNGGYIYWETDTKTLFYWDGTAYQNMSFSGIASPLAGDAIVYDGSNFVKSSAYKMNPSGLAISGTVDGSKFMHDDFSWRPLALPVASGVSGLPATPLEGTIALLRTAHNEVELYYNVSDTRWYSRIVSAYWAEPTGSLPGGSFAVLGTSNRLLRYFKEFYDVGLRPQVRFLTSIYANTSAHSTTFSFRLAYWCWVAAATSGVRIGESATAVSPVAVGQQPPQYFSTDWLDLNVTGTAPASPDASMVIEAMVSDAGAGGTVGRAMTQGANTAGFGITTEHRWRSN